MAPSSGAKPRVYRGSVCCSARRRPVARDFSVQLLVDDSSTTLMMEKMILNKGSFEVITAVNGEERS